MNRIDVNKRKILKLLPAATTLMFLPSTLMSMPVKRHNFLNNNGKIKPGVQLYSVRDALAQNSYETFKRLFDIGYEYLEWFDITTLEQQGPVAQSLGLKIASVHVLSPYLTGDINLAKEHGLTIPERLQDIESIAKLLNKFKVKFLVLSYLFESERKSIKQYEKLAEHLEHAGKICRKYNIQLCYHNHEFEFVKIGNTLPMDVLVENTSSQNVQFELDIFWLKYAGYDPAKYIKSLGSRVRLLHLKDLSEHLTESHKFAPLGQGNIDIPRVLVSAEASGVELCFVEQDQSPDIWNDLTVSYNYLQKLRS